MASAIRQRLGLPADGPIEFPDGLRVHNAEANGALHLALSANASYTSSEFFGDGHASGETIDGTRHENLQHLSFDDASLDLVLSSDVMEHMPDPYAAHRDIFRVLRPGGRHIFTVPFDASAAKDDVRAELIGEEIRYHGEALYHGDPIRPGEGILVWTIFGLEMIVRLGEIGYRPTVLQVGDASKGIIDPSPLVFEAYKP